MLQLLGITYYCYVRQQAGNEHKQRTKTIKTRTEGDSDAVYDNTMEGEHTNTGTPHPPHDMTHTYHT